MLCSVFNRTVNIRFRNSFAAAFAGFALSAFIAQGQCQNSSAASSTSKALTHSSADGSRNSTGAAVGNSASASPALDKVTLQALSDQLKQARVNLRQNPTDAKAHYQLAEALRKLSRSKESAAEYLQATLLDPTMLVAYHQLAQTCDDPDQLEEAISRLSKQKDDHPKDLMVRVALSEVYERKKNYLMAARTLIDLTYESGTIPVKYQQRVNTRIHYLLIKAKQAQLAEKDAVPSDDELDVVPVPLPDASLRKGLTASKIKESKEMKGVGHVPLLP